MAEPGRLRATDHIIIEHLLLGATQRQVADRTGISERTVRRRVADPGFKRRLQEQQAEAIKAVRRRVTASAVGANTVLMEIAADREDQGRPARREGAAARVAAARAVLQAFVRLQPLTVEADVYHSEVPIIDYTIEGVDPEVLR